MALIIRDTRDKIGAHDNVDKGLEKLGHKLIRSKMFVGDVALFDNQTTCIDLKQHMQEVYMDIVGAQHERFVRECKRAQDSGIRLIILVEQGGIGSVQDVAKWQNPRSQKWQRIHDGQIRGAYRGVKISPKPPVSSPQLAKAMQTISERYGAEWLFCKPEDTVKVICEVLRLF